MGKRENKRGREGRERREIRKKGKQKRKGEFISLKIVGEFLEMKENGRRWEKIVRVRKKILINQIGFKN